MTKLTKGYLAAKQLLNECGLDEITDIPMEDFVSGLGAMLIEEPLNGCDGKIIFGKRSVIKVNSSIQFEQRKRFVIAHEIGHLLMHKGLDLLDDTFLNFNLIEGMESSLKYGKQEVEANQFATELLMPEEVFLKETQGKPFSPLLIKQLSEKFNTSLTATVYRYLHLNLHPLCLVFIENGRVKYWKKSDDLKVFIENYTKLPPPTNSVAEEYIESGYDFLYKLDEKAQTIDKSVWFTLGDYDEDTEFYEYCIPTKRYKSILSIIWEE